MLLGSDLSEAGGRTGSYEELEGVVSPFLTWSLLIESLLHYPFPKGSEDGLGVRVGGTIC